VSPFGTRTRLPVYVEASVLALERIYINGGRRGLLVAIDPVALTALAAAVPVKVAVC
jgi:prolyl-tRNA editing enzyme YbaK/EbsC (Cys-tRNA(Pro) deacylase)